MTRVDNQDVHVTCNGEDAVAEYDRLPSGLLAFKRFIQMSKDGLKQTQPHAHWMGFDGHSMATPNSNTNDSTLFDFTENKILDQQATGALPIAAGMMLDSNKYYVSNDLGHTISVMCGHRGKGCEPGKKIKDIELLLGSYDVMTGPTGAPIGALPIRNAGEPGRQVLSLPRNTLTGTITIIDTKTDMLVKSLACDPGCHGVNFARQERRRVLRLCHQQVRQSADRVGLRSQ